MSTTPEQMQAMYAQMQRQRMEQQWAAMQGAYSGVPGAPVQAPAQDMMYTQDMVTMPNGQVLPRQQAIAAGYQQPVREPMMGIEPWQGGGAAVRGGVVPAPPPNYGMTGPYAATGGFPPGHPMALPVQPAQPVPGAVTPDPRMSIEPWQGGGAAVRGGVVPAPPAAEPMMTTQDMVTMPDGRVLNRQQAIAAGYQQPVRGAAEPMMTTMPVQGSPEQMRQRMEQQWAKQQGAFTGQAGAPVPAMDQRWRGQGQKTGLINQMNQREQDPYAGQNLTNEQRQTATANEQAVQKYRAGQNPAAAPALAGAQEQKQYAGGTPGTATGSAAQKPQPDMQYAGGSPAFMPDQYKTQLDEQMKQQKAQLAGAV